VHGRRAGREREKVERGSVERSGGAWGHCSNPFVLNGADDGIFQGRAAAPPSVTVRSNGVARSDGEAEGNSSGLGREARDV